MVMISFGLSVKRAASRALRLPRIEDVTGEKAGPGGGTCSCQQLLLTIEKCQANGA
jgi:hypothetical protein